MRALLLLGLAVASAFLGLMLWTTSGHFVAQASDLYVVAQYAKAMAEGHPFQYNAGEAPTTGATSLLHTAILALAHALGARGEGLVAFAVLFGATLYLASIPLAARVARRLAGEREGLLAGGLVALGGPVVWGYLYGSDIALFLFLALLLLDRWLAWWSGGSATGLAVAGTLVALARPEGLPMALVLGAASLGRPAPAAPRRERLLPWLPVAAGLLVLALQRALTGSWLSTSVGEKSLLPELRPRRDGRRRLQVRCRRAARAAPRPLPLRGAHRLLAGTGGLLLPAAGPRLRPARGGEAAGRAGASRCGCGSRSSRSSSRSRGRTSSWASTSIAT